MSSCSFDIQHKRKQPEHGLVAKCQDCNILQLETLISEFLNLRSRYCCVVATHWATAGLCRAHCSVLSEAALGQKCFKVKPSKEDKGESLLSHESY